MNAKDVKCPICGTVNRSLDLDETDGWMECESCHNAAFISKRFFVGKYISLEAKIAKNKDLYYDALAQSQNGWHEGTENILPFIKYLLGTILAAYKDLNERVALVETKLPALEMVRRASENKIGRFNKQDIRELCPTLSDSSIEGALRKLVSDGELKKEGKGKNTCYFRLK